MGLDLGLTALQIDRMADEVSARQSDYGERLGRAIDSLRNFDTQGYMDKLSRSSSTLAWNLPEPMDNPGAHYSPPALHADYRVVAADGSHIDVDRHLAARCFLINIGVAALTYGSAPDARLYSRPKLYAGDDELAIRDPASGREEQVQGAVLGAKRAVEELRALADAVRELPPETPTLALMDGTLVMMGIGLLRYGNRQFVLKHLVEDGFAQALAELEEMSRERPLAVASYVSLPNSAEVANSTRLPACPYEVAACEARCGGLPARARPCDVAVGGIRDRHIFAEMLAQGRALRGVQGQIPAGRGLLRKPGGLLLLRQHGRGDWPRGGAVVGRGGRGGAGDGARHDSGPVRQGARLPHCADGGSRAGGGDRRRQANLLGAGGKRSPRPGHAGVHFGEEPHTFQAAQVGVS